MYTIHVYIFGKMYEQEQNFSIYFWEWIQIVKTTVINKKMNNENRHFVFCLISVLFIKIFHLFCLATLFGVNCILENWWENIINYSRVVFNWTIWWTETNRKYKPKVWKIQDTSSISILWYSTVVSDYINTMKITFNFDFDLYQAVKQNGNT